MSDSTSNVPQVLTSQSSKEVTCNIDFNMASPAMLYAIWKIIGQTCYGLGGKVFISGVPTSINNWTLTLDFSATCYIRKLDSTGAVSFVTTIPTSWPAANGGYTPLHTVVMGASTFTSWVDHRVGIVDSAAPTGGGAPSGAAGGDLAGTYPNPTVAATVAKLANTNVWTKNQSVPFVALTDGTNIAVNAALSNNFSVTLGGNRTLDNPSNLTDGMVLNFYIEQDATGTRTLAFGSKYKFAGGTSTMSTAASARDLISGIYNSTDDIILCNLTKAYA